jgi:arylsulfatase A-like enzyme
MEIARWFIFSLVLVCALQTGRVVGDAEPVGTVSRPNILMIVIDDLNDWVDNLPDSHPDSATPNIDRLAQQGVNFTNAHSPSPVCNPSRIATLTGQHPRRTGIVGNKQTPMRDYLPDVTTLFQQFDQHGYWVAGTGKLFHGADTKAEAWDEWFNAGSSPKPDKRPWHGLDRMMDEVTRAFDWGPVDAPPAEFKAYRMADWAIDAMARERDEPFFISVGFMLPHLPWYMPKEHWDRIGADVAYPPYKADDREDMPPEAQKRSTKEHEIITEGDKWQEAIRAYLASSAFVDDQVGRVLEGLERSGKMDSTIVVLWTDHGWHLGEKDAWRKYSLWEESTRVPFIFAGPGIAHGESGVPVTLLDIYPTLVEMAGLPPVEPLDGVGLSAVLVDPDNGDLDREYVISSLSNGDTLRGERWRYTRYIGGDEELYDHSNDPNEWNNLAQHGDYEDVLNKYRPALSPQTRAPRAEPTR